MRHEDGGVGVEPVGLINVPWPLGRVHVDGRFAFECPRFDPWVDEVTSPGSRVTRHEEPDGHGRVGWCQVQKRGWLCQVMLLVLVAEIVVNGDDAGLMDGSSVVAYAGVESEDKPQKSHFQSRCRGGMNSGGRRDRRKKICSERLCSKNMQDGKKWIYEAHLLMGDEGEDGGDYEDSYSKLKAGPRRTRFIYGVMGG